jgi:hypothetical protein
MQQFMMHTSSAMDRAGWLGFRYAWLVVWVPEAEMANLLSLNHG